MEKKKKKKKKKKNKSIKNTFSKGFENESRFTLIEVIIIILISVVFGIIIGYLLTYGNSNLSRVRSDTNLGEVVSTYNNIVDNYYGKLDEKKLSESAIKGMISSLDDPYSSFLDEGSTDSFNESVDGEYVGIGVTVAYEEDYNYIVSMIDNGPGEKAGLKVGDIILSIDGNDCHNLYPSELNKLIDGKIGTKVTVKIKRNDNEKEFSIKRDVIEIQNVSSKIYNGIGYIIINIFSSNSYDQFSKELKKLEKKKIDSLIIDLRDNPGGHLIQARKILNLFFNKKTVLYQIEKEGSKEKVYAMDNKTKKYPIVILINGETASSAEVVAACFQDNYKKINIVGTNSYGKGDVQKSLSLNSGTSIKFTVEKWLTSKGKSVTDKGITPDTVIEQSTKYYVNYLEEDDIQLDEAIKILKESH